MPPAGNREKRQPGAHLRGDPTYFGVDRQVQDRLAKVRTDLDYFSDREAASLERDGYLIAKASEELPDLASAGSPICHEWRFSSVSGEMERPDATYLKELGAARKAFLRSLWLKPLTAVPVGLILLAALALVVYALLDPLGDLLEWCWPLGALAIAWLASLLPWVWSNLKSWMPWLYFRR